MVVKNKIKTKTKKNYKRKTASRKNKTKRGGGWLFSSKPKISKADISPPLTPFHMRQTLQNSNKEQKRVALGFKSGNNNNFYLYQPKKSNILKTEIYESFNNLQEKINKEPNLQTKFNIVSDSNRINNARKVMEDQIQANGTQSKFILPNALYQGIKNIQNKKNEEQKIKQAQLNYNQGLDPPSPPLEATTPPHVK